MTIDHNDWIYKENIGTRKRKMRFFRILCNTCGADRGYQLPAQDRLTNCNCCRKRSSRKIMDAASHPNVNFSDYIVDKNNICYYRCTCIKCGKDRGHRRSHEFTKICRSCIVIKPRSTLNPLQKKLKQRIGCRLRCALKTRNINKNGISSLTILGYGTKQLKEHLETLFLTGMTWDNIEEWHIDHIIPDSWFCYTSIDDADFKASWSLKNLQPLWAHDNVKKGNRFAG